MIEIMNLCKNYNLSITFEPNDDIKFITMRISSQDINMSLKFLFSYKELDNVVAKEAYVSNLIDLILNSLGLEK